MLFTQITLKLLDKLTFAILEEGTGSKPPAGSSLRSVRLKGAPWKVTGSWALRDREDVHTSSQPPGPCQPWMLGEIGQWEKQTYENLSTSLRAQTAQKYSVIKFLVQAGYL